MVVIGGSTIAASSCPRFHRHQARRLLAKLKDRHFARIDTYAAEREPRRDIGRRAEAIDADSLTLELARRRNSLHCD